MTPRGIPYLMFFLLVSFISISNVEISVAQAAIGGSLEIRSEDPSDGYSIRIEYRVLKVPPVADVRLRVHGSYFYENRTHRYENHGLVSEVFEENAAFDGGAAALAGISLGLLSPYAGAGLGIDSSRFTAVRSSSNPNRMEGINEENLYWNLFLGTEFTLIPTIHPFFEYRFIKLVNPRNVTFGDSERFSLGMIFRF